MDEFKRHDRVVVASNNNSYDKGGKGEVVGFTDNGWPWVLLDDHRSFGAIPYPPWRVRKETDGGTR